MPLMVVARNLGHRETRMVEHHYGHLAPSLISDAIRAHAPVFAATGADDAVVPPPIDASAAISQCLAKAVRITPKSAHGTRDSCTLFLTPPRNGCCD